MEEYIGLDVSMNETAVSIRRDGKRIWRGKCASDPRVVAELIRKRAPAVKCARQTSKSLATRGRTIHFCPARSARPAF